MPTPVQASVPSLAFFTRLRTGFAGFLCVFSGFLLVVRAGFVPDRTLRTVFLGFGHTAVADPNSFSVNDFDHSERALNPPPNIAKAIASPATSFLIVFMPMAVAARMFFITEPRRLPRWLLGRR